MTHNDTALFSLDCDRPFAEQVAERLGLDLAPLEERDFGDGEHKLRPLESVRGKDVYVIQSLYGGSDYSLNDKLVRLLFLLAVLRENGAARITALVPYLCYSRKDRKTKPRDPVTTRYVARLFEAMDVDRVLTVDVHNRAAFENAFRCGLDHLTAQGLFLEHLLPELGDKEITVASPDVGGVKRAEQFREALEARLERPVANAFLEKYRSEGKVRGSMVVGDVKDKTVLVLDDLIAGGGTMSRAAKAFKEEGAREVCGIATHGLFSGDAADALTADELDRLVITDSIPPFRLPKDLLNSKVDVVGLAPLLAGAIERLHGGGALTELSP